MLKHYSRLFRLVVCLLLVFCWIQDNTAMAVAIGSPKYGKNYNTGVTMTGDHATDIVTIAKAQKGKTKSGLGFSGPYCDAFVLDCARMANVPTSVIPNVRGCKALYQAILRAGGYTVSKSSARAGDIVVYYCPKCATYPHIGIYAGNNYVCEGNVAGGKVVCSDRSRLFYGDTRGHYSNNTVQTIYVRPNYGNSTAVSTTYTITFAANGAAGSMNNITATYGTSTTLSKNAFTYPGKLFAGWNVCRASDGKWLYSNGTDTRWYAEGSQPSGYLLYNYPDGASVSKLSAVDKDICAFYAVWTDMTTDVLIKDANWYPTKLVKGSSFTISGVVTSNYPLTKVTATVTNSSGAVQFSASASPNTTSYELYALDSKMTFSKLGVGTYTYKVSAANAYKSVTLLEKTFTVKSSFSSSTSGLKYPTTLVYGQGFNVAGTLTSSATIVTVNATISTTGGKILSQVIKNPNAKTFNVSSIASMLDFSKLPVDTYLYRLEIKDANHNGQYSVTLHFNVSKAASAPNWPASAMTLPYESDTVSSRDLPSGWVWYGEYQDVQLIPGVSAVLKAIYNGSDRGNYVNEIATVTVTRSECSHPKTEIVEASAAYTGDVCCTACESILESGKAIPPAAPLVKISGDAATGKNMLSWDVVENAAKYAVYRSTSMSSGYKKIDTVTGTSYTDKTATAGKNYYYKVHSVDVYGNRSKASSVVNRMCDLARPEITVKAVVSTGKPRVSWKAISGAMSYRVYRATSSGGTYQLLKTTTSTSYTDTSAVAGKNYYYKVRAVCSNSSGNSAYSLIKNRVCDLKQPVIYLSNVASNGKPRVTWKAVDGAVSYKLYRATSKNGTYKLLKTTTSTGYTDTSTKAGKVYYYKLVAVCSNSAGNSAASAVKCLRCDLYRPSVSGALTSGGTPRLTWKAIGGAVSYKVYRSTSKDGDYKLVKTTTSTKFTDTSAVAGKTYYYKVVAIHSTAAANSAYSAVVKLKAK